MRITLIMIASLVTLDSAAHAELIQSQSLTTSLERPALSAEALTRDSQTLNANTLGAVAGSAALAAANSTSQDTVVISSAASANTVADDNSTLSNDDISKAAHDNSLLDRLSTVASDTVHKFKQSGIASWYGHQFNGHKTATGERYDMNAMTAAHRSLPLSCFIRVTNKDNGKSVIVKVNDRGPYIGNRILDLSYAAAQKIGIVDRGMGNVTIERVSSPE